MNNRLKALIVWNVLNTWGLTLIDRALGYDGQNTIFLWPLLLVSFVLSPIVIIWCIVFLVKATEKVATSNVLWLLLAGFSIVPFFIGRF